MDVMTEVRVTEVLLEEGGMKEGGILMGVGERTRGEISTVKTEEIIQGEDLHTGEMTMRTGRLLQVATGEAAGISAEMTRTGSLSITKVKYKKLPCLVDGRL